MAGERPSPDLERENLANQSGSTTNSIDLRVMPSLLLEFGDVDFRGQLNG